jgi:hypothetical protein
VPAGRRRTEGEPGKEEVRQVRPTYRRKVKRQRDSDSLHHGRRAVRRQPAHAQGSQEQDVKEIRFHRGHLSLLT